MICCLAVAIVAPLLATHATTARAEGAKLKVIVLPLAGNTEVGGAELAERVHRALRLTLESSGQATIVSLRPSTPSVRRAIDTEKTLEPSDLEVKPPVDPQQAARLGQALGADLVLWGSVYEYTYNKAAKQVTLGLTLQKFDVRTNESSAVAVSGRSSSRIGFAAAEGALMTEAMDDAVGKAVEGVLGTKVSPVTVAPAPTAPQQVKRADKTWQTLGAVIAAGALIALANNGGGGAAAAPAANIVTAAAATPTADSVALSWSVTAGTSGVTSFNVYRREVGGVSRMVRPARAAHSRVRLTRQAGGYFLLANVGRADRSYNDSSANPGTLYAYHVSTVVGVAESAPMDFINVYEPTIEVGPAYPRAPAMPTVTPFVSSIGLQWSKNPEPFIDSYRIYRATSASGPWNSTTLVGEVPSSQASFTDAGPLVAGATYYYAIGAVTAAADVNGRIGPARQVLFEIGKPAPPSNVRAQPRVGGVYLTWVASTDLSVSGYNVYRDGELLSTVSGGATTSFLDSPLAAGSYAYQVASFTGTPPVESDLVSALPSPVSPSLPPSSLAITPPEAVVANGTSTTDVVATVRDGSAQPVQGVEVTFSLSGGGGVLQGKAGYTTIVVVPGTELRVITHADGTAGVRFMAGTNAALTPTVTATCAGASGTLTDDVTITLEQRVPTAVTLAAESLTLVGDGISSTTLTATVTDQGGGPYAGQTVAFASQSPGLGDVSPASADTGADGTAATTLSSAGPGQYGNCVVTATVTGLTPAQVTVRFAAAPQVTVSVQPSVLPAAGMGASALITATVKYIGGEPVDDDTIVRFSFEGEQTISDTGARIVSGRERALTRDGIAYSTMYSAVDLANGDSDIIWVWIDLNDNGAWDGASETLGSTVVSYTDPPFRITVAAEPLSIPAGGSSISKIVADVRTQVPDPSGGGYQPVADGTLVTFSTTAGTFADTAAATASGRTIGGLVTVFLKSGADAGTANVTAIAALINGSTQVEFTAPVNTVVLVFATPRTLQANGTATSTIRVRVTDGAGQPQADESVTLSCDLGSLSATSLTTDTNGEATATFTAGRTSGTATIIASVSGATGFTTLTLTSGLAQNVSLTTIAPNIIMPATNGLPSPSGASPTAAVYARVTDKYGNPVVDGTPVYFHTDIGQIAGSVLTTNGLATATLTTCNFLDATNKATYRPGWASVTAYAENPAGAATAGPAYEIFCGNVEAYNWDGSANDTDVYTGYGADWRLGATGSSDLGAQPNLVPRAGDIVRTYITLADRNNNPLPVGITVKFEFWLDGKLISSTNVGTEMGVSPGGIQVCGTYADFTPQAFPNKGTTAYLAVVATVPTIVDTYSAFSIGQYVGAGGPSGNIEIISVTGGPLQLPGGPWVITATLTDKFGNPVQDNTPVYFSVQNPTNVTDATVSFQSNPAFTVSGTATTLLSVQLLDESKTGNFTIFAGSPQGGPSSDAKGTLGVTVNPPPGGGVRFEIGYPDTNAVLTQTYPIGPGLQLIANAFSIHNAGTQQGTIYISNITDAGGKVYPSQYATFRVHSVNPPAIGADPLPIAVAADTTIWMDVIVKTDGLNAIDSPYGSQIGLLTPVPGTITYLMTPNPQRIAISVQ
jgi:hypothetical protein